MSAGHTPTVIVHHDLQGYTHYFTAPGVRLLVIDEATPHDRVYQVSRQLEPAEQAALIGKGPIGSCDDERHAAMAARIEEALGGPKRLTLVDAETKDPTDG